LTGSGGERETIDPSGSMQGSADPARRDVVTDQDQRRDAVDVAYREHADDVYRVAFAILRDTEAAVDATHDTFARAFERWDQYDSDRSLRAWLHGIVSHAALDALRRRRVRRLAAPAVAQLGPVMAGGAWGAADPSTGIADRDLVEVALADLKPDVRAALVLRHYYGYDYAEIAGFLRTSPGNVGSILSRAHAALRERLTGEAAPADPVIPERAVQ
jgi:RNA polymerase sigma-70 factor, ECF subfamily